jgi:arylsulfatase
MAAPNIVFILTDQQRADSLGCTGCPVAQTPRLDRLAREGVVFDRHFVANPVCSPSRGAIFTGRLPSENGVWFNGCRLPHEAMTLPRMLGRAGYQTAHFGKLHLEPIVVRTGPAHAYGFDICEIGEGDQHLLHDDYNFWLRKKNPQLFVEYWNQHFAQGHDTAYTPVLPEELTLTHWATDRAINWLETRPGGPAPFFLSIGYFAPHHPFNPPEPYATRLAHADIPPPHYDAAEFATKPRYYRDFEAGLEPVTRNPERMRAIQRNYHGLVAHVDACIGRVVDTLERLGLRKNTVIVFSSDHGEFLGEHGMLWKGPFLLDDLMQVPMVVSWPARLRGGQRTTALTSAVDFFGTFAALAGGADPVPPDSRALFDREGRLFPGGARDHVRFEWDHPDEAKGNRCLRGLRTDSHKLVHYSSDPATGELYDLASDPREFRNRYNDPAVAGIQAGLFARLAERPLSGHLPVPYEGGW